MRPEIDRPQTAREARHKLAAALRMFAECDFDEGAAGHLTARDPGSPDWVFMNPVGLPFDEIRASDLTRVSLVSGELEGAPIDRGGLRLHAAIYAARPDVGSVMHAHPVHTKAFSVLGRPLDPISQEACIFYGRHAVLPEYRGVFGATEEGAAVADLLGSTNVAVILKHHAAVTVGDTVDMAAYRFFILDRCCHVQLLAEAAARPGEIAMIDHDVAAALAGDTWHSHASFAPMYRSIVRRHPDLLE